MDAGGFFPEDELHQDAAWFLMDAMKMLGTDAVGVGDADLRFGFSYLRTHAAKSRLPLVSSNLLDKSTHKPAFPPSIIKKVGNVTVGIFGLISDKVNLGPSGDSLMAEEPTAVARRMAAELRKKGATVVVLLSQLGRVETEDLVSAVDGIDVAVVGRSSAMIQKGRMIKNTIAVYGGEQGQHFGRTIVNLDQQRKPRGMECDVYVLGPEVGEKTEVANLVKGFEDSFNEKLRKAEKERAAREVARQASNDPDHYLGGEVCARCHVQEAAQWKTTAHAHALQTLIDKKKDATPDCIPCHVVGYNKPGGFASRAETPVFGNVQCENCHGIGTQHESFVSPPRKIAEQTCVTCHTSSTSPTFNFATYLPHVMHKYSGTLPPLPAHGSTMGGGN